MKIDDLDAAALREVTYAVQAAERADRGVAADEALKEVLEGCAQEAQSGRSCFGLIVRAQFQLGGEAMRALIPAMESRGFESWQDSHGCRWWGW